MQTQKGEDYSAPSLLELENELVTLQSYLKM